MTEQPTALRLAERLAVYLPKPQDMIDAAAELRRLHAQRDALLEALKELLDADNYYPWSGLSASELAAIDKARAAIKKAEEGK